MAGKPIALVNHGLDTRDFTYIEEIAKGIILASDQIAEPSRTWNASRLDPATSNAPFRIFNIGNIQPVKLTEYVTALEEALDRKAKVELLPLQPGDVPDTFADVSELERAGWP